MKKNLLPTSKARTAYGLLSEIAKLALEEPKRMDMGQWVTNSDCETARGLPACGTVGCIGGWVETLKRAEADYVLGLGLDQHHQLFYPHRLMSHRPQTVTHARAVVAHIRRFQKKYRAQLLAKKV